LAAAPPGAPIVLRLADGREITVHTPDSDVTSLLREHAGSRVVVRVRNSRATTSTGRERHSYLMLNLRGADDRPAAD
jgi:hypothetical protein